MRRAVTMRGTAAEPDAQVLRPRTAEEEVVAPTREPASSGDAAAHGEVGGPPAVVAPPSSPRGEADSAEAGPAEPTAPAAPAASETPVTSGADADSAAEPASAAKNAGDESGAGDTGDLGAGAVGALGASEGGSPPGASRGETASGGDEPPSGRPTKALLAAAGIGGALLIAVPFLVMGTHHGDRTEPAALAEKASARTLQKDEEPVRPGEYAPKSPPAEAPSPKTEAPEEKRPTPLSPTPTAEATAEVKEKKKEESGKDGKEEKKEQKAQKAEQKKAVAAPNYANMKGVLLRNISSTLCADIPYYDKGKVNGPVNQFYCDNTDKDNQLWDFEVRYKGQGPRSTDLFQIRNRKDGLCIDLPNYGGQPAGTRISEFHCNGTTGDNQLWWLESRGDKSFWIHNYASNHQCLEVVSGPEIKPVNARLDIQPCHGGNDFEWTLW
ncbi:ricin-type beta-trefoil lectin domain protein [Streptomyces sp. DSM 41014]|uniref:Ricin-type beta-trefoil lectin domain protein n=1 Tax=Streptomyces hintoniae TaxID=3075521 RepID=A0ABU2UEE8_9ACTN|nr:RICIN domain-containing protein [Streptomyces sp. DSM 41014]MDT0471504.1 ricin-type beta-trefoil lectin domain protein [Streptomyces sp. DSM 41014]